MKTAKELYEISQHKIPEIVTNTLKGAEEHMKVRCEEEANKGATRYTFYVRPTPRFCNELLFQKCLEIVRKFEDLGFQVSIYDSRDSENHMCALVINLSWDGRIVHYVGRYSGMTQLYDTEYGICREIDDYEY